MPYSIVKSGSKFVVQKKDGSKKFGTHDTEADAKKQLDALYANEPKAMRALHLQGALGIARTEWLGDREYLVVPTVALIGDNVIHAVNATESEFVPTSVLSAAGWERQPLMLGHPTKDGVHISAHDPSVLAASSFGFTSNPKVNGRRLGMESWCDVQKLETLGQQTMLADLRAGKPVEVSTGSIVKTLGKSGTHNGKRYTSEWASMDADHLAFLPGGKGACSVEMGCGAHRAAMRVMEGSDELQDLKEGSPMPKALKDIKARILALFDTGEADAAEEAAELIAYNSMRTMLDAAGAQWDETSKLVDALIADEEENPTETRQQESAEETVEDARLDAIRMLCYSMSSALNNIVSVTYKCQLDPVTPSDPRYMEQFKALVGKEISAKNLKTIQAAHDSSHDVHTQTVALGASCDSMKAMATKMKDCPTCEGTGQTKVDGKQQDCPTCSGDGQVRAAESFRAAGCGCQEGTVEKKERIAALVANAHNPVKDITEKTSDEVLTVLEAAAESNKKHADELKAAQAKQTETEEKLKAAQAAQISPEELAHFRSLAAERTASDAAAKATLVERLVPLKTLSKEELEKKSLDELKTLAAFAKVETQPVDYSIKGFPVPRSAEGVDQYAAPDSYGLKALQTKAAAK